MRAAPVVLALLLGGCASALYLDPREAADRLARLLVAFPSGGPPETVTVENEHGHRLEGWLFAAPGDRGVVLAGGGASNPTVQTHDYYRFLIGRGFRVLFLGYQGFPGNEGPAHLGSWRGDWLAFAQYARRRFPGEPLAYAGLSIGATAALCAAAAGTEPDALILDGVIDLERLPYARARRRWWLYPLLPLTLPVAAVASASVPESLDADRCATRGRASALFVHDPQDRIGPFPHAVDLYLRYRGPKAFFLSAAERHDDFHVVLAWNEEAQATALAFLRGALEAKRTPPKARSNRSTEPGRARSGTRRPRRGSAP